MFLFYGNEWRPWEMKVPVPRQQVSCKATLGGSCFYLPGASGDAVVKNPLANVGDTRDVGSIQGVGRSPEAETGNPLQGSCWKIPWTEKPGGLQSMRKSRVGHNSTQHSSSEVAQSNTTWRLVVLGTWGFASVSPWTNTARHAESPTQRSLSSEK